MKNYGELKSEIALWCDREDAAFIAQVPSFVRLTETLIYRDLRVRDNEFTVNLTATDNPKNPITLPQNYREMKLVTVNDFPIERWSDQKYNAFLGAQYTGGNPPIGFATIERKLYLMPWTYDDIDIEDTNTVNFSYYGTESLGEMATWDTATNANAIPESDGTPAAFTERTDAATTRMFLIQPDMYLHGGLYFAYIWLKDAQSAAEHKTLFVEALTHIKGEQGQSDYAGSTVSVGSTYYDGRYA